MDALQKISQSCMKNELPSFEVGDTVRVQVKIKEGDKERLQAFEGTVIGIKKGGINSTFTVRRISHGCGVERVFPMHSPNAVSYTHLSSERCAWMRQRISPRTTGTSA